MPFYYNIHRIAAPENKERIASGILTLKAALKNSPDDQKNPGVPARTRSSTVLLATWNIREFESAKYGPRMKESLYYIAEIIDHFDIVAIQEVRDDLSSLEEVMRILGSSWDYLLTDVTAGRQGNFERIAFVYDKRKISFGGLAGEIVIPPAKDGTPFQYARTPFIVGFRSGWFKFTICSAHMYYGKNVPNDPQRIKEIKLLSEHLAAAVKDKYAWAKNMILLGDFNIFNVGDETFEAMKSAGFKVNPKIAEATSNVGRDRIFDQIAFIAPDLKDNLEDCNAGVFSFFDHVYTMKQESLYQAFITPPTKYKDWRTYQMSDHYPMWIELRVDFSKEYLEEIAKGAIPAPEALPKPKNF